MGRGAECTPTISHWGSRTSGLSCALQSAEVRSHRSLRCSQVVCVHPGWEALGGKSAVVDSWARIFGNQPGFIVSGIGSRAFVISDSAAFVVCTERMPGGEAVATNVFCLEDGEWRICHHQSGQGRGLKSTEEDAEQVRSTRPLQQVVSGTSHDLMNALHGSLVVCASQFGLGLETLSAAIRNKRKRSTDDDDVVSAPSKLAPSFDVQMPRL